MPIFNFNLILNYLATPACLKLWHCILLLNDDINPTFTRFFQCLAYMPSIFSNFCVSVYDIQHFLVFHFSGTCSHFKCPLYMEICISAVPIEFVENIWWFLYLPLSLNFLLTRPNELGVEAEKGSCAPPSVGLSCVCGTWGFYIWDPY